MKPAALLWIGIEPKSEADRDKLRDGLAALMAEDPAIRVTTGATARDVVIGGSGELHLEIILDRLRREFGVAADVGRPQVAYKETLTRPADGDMKYARQTADRGEYGHVKIHVYPGAPGTGCVFENEIVGGAIPGQFITSVHEGIRDALTGGVLAGYPVDDVRITLYDGSYHDVDSSEIAFRLAAAMAFHDAAKRAGPVLLEPVMRVEVVVPEEDVDDVTASLTSRRGQLLAQEGRAGMQVLTALVPLGEMFGYSTELRDRTRGRGTFTMRFARYQPCRPADEGGGESFVGAPRTRPPTLRTTHVALPEPEDPGSGL